MDSSSNNGVGKEINYRFSGNNMAVFYRGTQIALCYIPYGAANTELARTVAFKVAKDILNYMRTIGFLR